MNENENLQNDTALDFSPQESFAWPQQAMNEQNWLEALKRWKVLNKAYPEIPYPQFQIVHCLIEIGQFSRAMSKLEIACQANGNHPGCLLEKAHLESTQNNHLRANDYLVEAREKFPENIAVLQSSIDVAEMLDNNRQALEHLLALIQLTPDRPMLYIRYADIAEKENDLGEAFEICQKAFERFPKNKAIFDRYLKIARLLGKESEVRGELFQNEYGETNQVAVTKVRSQNFRNKNKVANAWQLIWTKTRLNLRAEVQQNYLSYLWWIIEPLLHMSVYYIVFAVLLDRGGENYSIFLLTGLIPWMWFMKSVIHSSNSIISGQNIINQFGVPSIILPSISILQIAIKQVPIFLGLLIVVWWFVGINQEMLLWLFPVVILQFLMIVVVSLTVAAVTPFVRDIAVLVPSVLTFLMFMSGVFFNYKDIPVIWQDVFLLNPVAFLLKCYREVLLENTIPDIPLMLYEGLVCIGMITVLLMLYSRFRYHFPRVLQS